jgi:hypothetical protein
MLGSARVGAVLACGEAQKLGRTLVVMGAVKYFGFGKTYFDDRCAAYTALKLASANGLAVPVRVEDFWPFPIAQDGLRILAHPESRFTVYVPDGSKEATVSYGMEDASWAQVRTAGVVFTLTDESGKELWSRYLRPLEKPADRGEQRVTIPVRGKLLGFKTNSRGSPAWDWAYWSRVDFK